ncbi:hypothetical protein D9M70_516950 [compost metagenome]
MEAVSATRPCGAEAFKGQLDALPVARIRLPLCRDRRPRCWVARADLQPRHIQEGAQVLQVVTLGEGEHHGAAGIVDALAQQQLAIGALLQELVEWVGFQGKAGGDRVALVLRP